MDQNMLLAMVAPRGLMMYSGYAEHEGNPFGFEQAYRSARSVYRLLGQEENIWLHLRAGEHGTTDADIETFMDFFDTVFGRRKYPQSETWTHGYIFDEWRELSGERINPLQFPRRAPGEFAAGDLAAWEKRKPALRRNLAWALGEEPPGMPLEGGAAVAKLARRADNWLALLLQRPLKRRGMSAAVLPFGDGLHADLYYPTDADGRPKPGPWPVIIWLHSHAYHAGYSRYAGPSFETLTRRGFAVVAFDQLGFGTRVLDAKDFYRRYPRWSLMGKMIADTRAAIDAAAGLDTADAARIYVVGYGLGAKVGLLAAALDERVCGLAAVCGFDPLRLDTDAKGTEGIRHYSHLHGLMPKLGFFIGEEARLPFDFDQALAMIAPRPVLVVAPELDRYARVADVRREMEGPRKIYRMLGHEDALRLDTPLDFNRFKAPRQEQVFDWLASLR